MVKRYVPTDAERAHAEIAGASDYGPECVIPLPDGRAIHTPAHPEPCSYVRVTFEGREIVYWVCDEWQEAPEEVMGAIMGILKSAIVPA